VPHANDAKELKAKEREKEQADGVLRKLAAGDKPPKKTAKDKKEEKKAKEAPAAFTQVNGPPAITFKDARGNQ